MAMNFVSYEKVYLVACVLLVYFLNIDDVVLSAFLGVMACFLFFPSYYLLARKVYLVSFRQVFIACLVATLCLLPLYFVLSGESSVDRVIFFVATYLAAKTYRLFMIKIFNKEGALK